MAATGDRLRGMVGVLGIVRSMDTPPVVPGTAAHLQKSPDGPMLGKYPE